MLLRPLILVLLFASVGCVSRSHGGRFLEKAEEYLRREMYEEAIQEYNRHIDYRLGAEKRQEWENPFFYQLFIGDIRIKQGQIPLALESYQIAEIKGVSKPLVSDRYRYVARIYEERGQLEEALEILEKYRDRDPLLFDAILDRIARRIVQEEEAKDSRSNVGLKAPPVSQKP